MIGCAAGNDMKPFRHVEAVELAQAHAAFLRIHPAGEAVDNDAGLLEDFLEHEVAVAALLG